MNFDVKVDWKFLVALGQVAVSVIFALKMDAEAAERVSTYLVDVLNVNVVAENSHF